MSSGNLDGPFDVVATVGTDVHPFDRMVDWIDDWALANDAGTRVFIQFGTSRAPVICQGSAYLEYSDLQDHIRNAKVVITHGGPATIMEVRSLHGMPIVTPRDPLRGEHVDGHQLDFCHMLARRGDIAQATSAANLADLINNHIEAPPRRHINSEAIPEGVRGFASAVDDLLGVITKLQDDRP